MVDHLRLCKHRADAADLHWFGRAQSVGAEVVGGQPEVAGGLFEKRASAGRTLVVQAKGLHPPFGVDFDSLDVLAADVEDGARVGKQMHRGARVRGELGDLGIAKRNGVAAIAGRRDVGDHRALEAAVLQQLLEGGLCGLRQLEAGTANRGADDFALIIEGDRLGIGRSDIDTDDV